MAGIHPLLPLALCFMVLITACVSTPSGSPGPGDTRSPPGVTYPVKEDPWTIPTDKFVFIDHHVSLNGEAINGSCGGGMMIDFPMYSFNRETGELGGMSARDLTVNESLQIVYGDGMSLGGALGGGASTYLTPVYALPFEKSGIIITSVTPEGLAILKKGNETIRLPAHETWTNVSVITETRTFPGSDGPCTMKTVRTETIFNAGVLLKSGILTS
jgi:hypothetical protein